MEWYSVYSPCGSKREAELVTHAKQLSEVDDVVFWGDTKLVHAL